MQENQFEMYPGRRFEGSGERDLAEGEGDFEKAMQNGVPEFSGEQFGVANEKNEYYGESVGASEDGEEFNETISNAASIINYGLDAASRELGVEQVVQRINDFDPSESSNPIGDLYLHLGVDTAEERKNVRDEAVAAAPAEAAFRDDVNAPATMNKTNEGAIKAIEDMKELVAEVEGADPRYEELRNNAKSAGMGYFEYAVKDYGVRGLTELFGVLSQQKKKAEEEAGMKNGDDDKVSGDGENTEVDGDVDDEMRGDSEAETVNIEDNGINADVDDEATGNDDESRAIMDDEGVERDLNGEVGQGGRVMNRVGNGTKEDIVTLNQDILKSNNTDDFDGNHSDEIDEELMRHAA